LHRLTLSSSWVAVVKDGDTFKVTVFYPPYFYVGVTDDALIPEVTQLLLRRFDQVGEEVVTDSAGA
jgi:hypothetical protein